MKNPPIHPGVRIGHVHLPVWTAALTATVVLITGLMRIPPVLPAVAALLFIAVLSLSGCVNNRTPQSHAHQGGPSKPGLRVPPGADTRHNAAVRFFNAYKTHNRTAAKEVATDAAINALVFNASAGTNPTLQLVDDTHIYYEGGSIELTLARNAAGRWYMRSVTSTAD